MSPTLRLLPFLLTGWLTVSAWAQPAPPQNPSQLARAIDAVLADRAFANAFWGVVVVDLESGETLYRRNADKSFVPASNVKLYTTAAALDQLGPEYRYETRLYIDGPIVDGVLHGNLIVRGAGDPTLGGHYDPETGEYDEFADATKVFRDWADSLRAAGITEITGDLIGDDDIVDDEPLGPGWSWNDETYYYAAQLSGLSFNDNVVHVQIRGRQNGQPGSVTWQPFETDYVEIVNQTRTGPSNSSIREGYRRERGTNRIILTSRVPAGRVDSEALTVDNPTLFAVHVLRETLHRAGITVHGRPVDVDSLADRPDYVGGGLRRVAVHTSRPLSDVVRMINKPSQNLYAEMLLKTLAAERAGAPGTQNLVHGSTEMGLKVAERTFARAGIDTEILQLVDGSGLSRRNLVTPEMTAALLRYMWNHPDEAVREAFYASLPIAGVDGSLRNRLRSGPAYRHVRAKTGTLGNVSSLSGYVRSARGTPLAFVMMTNHYTAGSQAVRNAQDAIATLLARYQE